MAHSDGSLEQPRSTEVRAQPKSADYPPASSCHAATATDGTLRLFVWVTQNGVSVHGKICLLSPDGSTLFRSAADDAGARDTRATARQFRERGEQGRSRAARSAVVRDVVAYAVLQLAVVLSDRALLFRRTTSDGLDPRNHPSSVGRSVWPVSCCSVRLPRPMSP